MKTPILLATTLSLIYITAAPLMSMDCCLRFFCGCCLSPKKSKSVQPARNEHRIEAIRGALRNTQSTNPGALRELYLKCQLPEYIFSPEADEYLEIQLFTDHASTISEEDRVIILSLLQPSEFCSNSLDWYYYQRVVDFTLRYPRETAQFRASCLAASCSVTSLLPVDLLAILHGTYGLITNAESISLLEKHRIAEMIAASDTPLEQFTIAQPARSVRPPIRSSEPTSDK